MLRGPCHTFLQHLHREGVLHMVSRIAFEHGVLYCYDKTQAISRVIYRFREHSFVLQESIYHIPERIFWRAIDGKSLIWFETDACNGVRIAKILAELIAKRNTAPAPRRIVACRSENVFNTYRLKSAGRFKKLSLRTEDATKAAAYLEIGAMLTTLGTVPPETLRATYADPTCLCPGLRTKFVDRLRKIIANEFAIRGEKI